jgi:diguanylate cyclase (GGDEF)-like protein
VARIGGDEFAVLLPGATAPQAERVAEKITAAVASVWPIGGRGGASVGVTALERGDRTALDVLAAADRAMYTVKRSRRFRRAS